MTLDQTRQLNDKQLFRHFRKTAKFVKDAPAQHAYVIRAGSKLLTSDSTHGLWDKYKERIRS